MNITDQGFPPPRFACPCHGSSTWPHGGGSFGGCHKVTAAAGYGTPTVVTGPGCMRRGTPARKYLEANLLHGDEVQLQFVLLLYRNLYNELLASVEVAS